ncbi:MAG: transcriptional regulator [Cyanobacteria bacterium P01_E01_bin.42]
MKTVKTPLSDSWQEALVESLRDPLRAANYIEAILDLEGEELDPKLLRAGLQDVIESRKRMNFLSDEIEQSYQTCDRQLEEFEGKEIYALIECLNALGFVLEIKPKKTLSH